MKQVEAWLYPRRFLSMHILVSKPQIPFRGTFCVFRGYKTGIFTFSSDLARKCLSIWPGMALLDQQPEENSGVSASSSQTLFLCISVRIFFLQFY